MFGRRVSTEGVPGVALLTRLVFGAVLALVMLVPPAGFSTAVPAGEVEGGSGASFLRAALRGEGAGSRIVADPQSGTDAPSVTGTPPSVPGMVVTVPQKAVAPRSAGAPQTAAAPQTAGAPQSAGAPPSTGTTGALVGLAPPVATEPISVTQEVSAAEVVSATATVFGAQEVHEPDATALAAAAPRVLAICLAAEPASLDPAVDVSHEARLIREAVYGGPIDTVAYTLGSPILEKVPSLADGDAVIQVVEVREGDRVVDDAGAPVVLAPGMQVRPASCRASACAVTFDGTPLLMDQMVVTFRLQPDLLWADGRKVTAYDAAFGFRQALARQEAAGAPTGEAGALAVRTASYTAADAQTVLWIGMPGFLTPAYARAFWTPLPAHRWAPEPDAELPVPDRAFDDQPYAGRPYPDWPNADRPYAEVLGRTPVGYGPYVIDRWAPGEAIVALPNPLYTGPDGLGPAFDEVVFRFLDGATSAEGALATSVTPADRANAALDALERGECDLLAAGTQLEHALPRLEALQAAGTARVVVRPGTTVEQLVFNVAPLAEEADDDVGAPGDTASDADEARLPFFADVRTRQALATCLDRHGLMTAVTHGYGHVLDTYVPPDHPLYTPDGVTVYPYRPSWGTRLLAQVGWRDESGDGVREAYSVEGVPDGTPFAVEYLTTSSDAHVAIAQMMAEQLRERCGIVLKVKVLAPWELFAQNEAGPLVRRQFDLAQIAVTTGLTPRCEGATTAAIPTAATAWTGANVGGYSDVSYDRACAQAAWALPGEPGYVEAHHQLQRIFADTLPVLPLFRHATVLAARPDLQGIVPDALAVETWRIEAFRLDEGVPVVR